MINDLRIISPRGSSFKLQEIAIINETLPLLQSIELMDLGKLLFLETCFRNDEHCSSTKLFNRAGAT